MRVVDVPASEIAASIGGTKFANMVMLSALLAETGIIKKNPQSMRYKKLTPQKRKKALGINKEAIVKAGDILKIRKAKISDIREVQRLINEFAKRGDAAALFK